MKKRMDHSLEKISLIFLFLLTVCSVRLAAQTTTVSGTITDAKQKAPMPFVNVFIPGTSIGTQTDVNGKFSLQFTGNRDSLHIASLGYKTFRMKIANGTNQVINVRLETTSRMLGEVIVKSGKRERYRNKNNPAVELIRLVIDNRDKNRIEHYNYTQYNQYEKLEFALSNSTEKFQKSRFLKKYKFIFDNRDTTKVEGKALLPVYLEEISSDIYYRKDPEKKKEIVRGEKKVSFEDFIDNQGLSQYLNHIYQDYDIYDNNLMLFTNQFLSPIANAGPTFYKYFITDTVVNEEGTKLVEMEFVPRNQTDLLLQGKLYVTLDGNYAIRKADMTGNKRTNINWVRDFRVIQEFEKAPDGRFYTSKKTLQADFTLFANSKGGVYGERTVSVKDFEINKQLPDDFYKGAAQVKADSVSQVPESFWAENRHDTLTGPESKVYANIDSLQHMRSFRRTMDIITLLLAGYKQFGPIEVGPVNTFYSFNPVEGFRGRLGGRTTPRFNKSIYLESYGAYGFKDKKWKYYFGGTYSFTHRSIWEFPVRSLSANYQHDMKIPGQELQFVQEDNFLLSFKRGNNDKWLYNDIYNITYLHELQNHTSFKLGFKNWRQQPAGSLAYIKGQVAQDSIRRITTQEFSLQFRWAPHEQFYSGKNFRVPIPNKYPIVSLTGTVGVKGLLGGQYNYQNLQLNIYKMMYLSPIGYSEVVLEGGYTFGKVPFPLLTIHHANQTYAYQLESYNLMNFLEFVSDHYASLNIDHHFNGFIFNKIPLMKRLKLREVAAVKVLVGGVRKENMPENDPSLFNFPVGKDGVPATYTLSDGPYVEGSVGIANIFRLIRVDLVKRFTYLDHPDISSWGIRTRVRFDF
ncbi:DUF5686 and carboxypeptidase-like regulatory domain-containing protein [uncultured Chitinophaga sp.]|jgi:hypothetical protein|uniref:DUF5686 and carboxypeptidase-like regulatory domain-containing protein n=1 Tax=uncultured Chitinophaga sp. TaxID=339340 RepID=UPI0026189573|nr:DUF5686 and carboxypeptidase-like regulatory domain-containing protein [uncultured Chitinophaga sp.]